MQPNQSIFNNTFIMVIVNQYDNLLFQGKVIKFNIKIVTTEFKWLDQHDHLPFGLFSSSRTACNNSHCVLVHVKQNRNRINFILII